MPGVTVRAGDTLSAIAARSNVTLAALLAANPQISNPNAIGVGQALALPGEAATPATSAAAAGATAGGELDYVMLVRAHGSPQARADLDAGRAVLLGLRMPSSFAAGGGRGEYNDTLALIRKDRDAFRSHTYRFNTEPSSQYLDPNRPNPPDANKDGRPDLGQLKAGQTIEYGHGVHLGRDALKATSDAIVERDTNQDRRITPEDPEFTHANAAFMHIHIGGATNTFSMGCQTLPPEEHAKFFMALKSVPQKKVCYVLINDPRFRAS